MKKLMLLIGSMFLLCSNTAFGWGRLGHDAVAYIAECHLTTKAKKNIEKYLDHSIVYFASWMDDWRKQPGYEFTSVWHGAAVDEHFKYVASPDGDAVSALNDAIATLANYKSESDSTVIVNLKYIIHLMGDMHCPVHVRRSDIEGFRIFLTDPFGSQRRYTYHSVWDTQIFERRNRWHYMEYAHQLDRCSKKEIQAICTGSIQDWFEQNARETKDIYALVKPGRKLDKAATTTFLNRAQPIAERQVLMAGYRLAKVLNELFG